MQRSRGGPTGGAAGFTLVEALVAIVVLIFGLMAVSNLMLVAGSSTSVANQGTAATVAASQVLDALKITSWENLVPGGDITADVGATNNDCTAAVTGGGTYNCNADVPGVGLVHVRWQITPPAGATRTLFIQVRAEGTGALSGARSRSEFTSLRVCTDASPAPENPGGPACPAAPAGCPAVGCGG
jgi:Tfp pilus assembly protein PilV